VSDITDRIGEVSESIARTACERLREQGKIRSYLCVDTHGIDFLLITSCWQAMPLQVKTSWFGAKRHYKKYPGIPVIVIRHRSVRMNKRRKRCLVETAEFQILELLAVRKYTISFMFFLFVFSRKLQSRYAA